MTHRDVRLFSSKSRPGVARTPTRWENKRMNQMLANLQMRRDDERGFTLIELVVVVLVIAILIAIAIPTFLRRAVPNFLGCLMPSG